MQDTACQAVVGPGVVSRPPFGDALVRWLRQPYCLLGTLVLAYIGVYLCRKNISVAVPLIQQEWGISKSQVGWIASISTIAYALGKIVLGPLVDRVGGRLSLLASMGLVAAFGLAGALAPGLISLVVLYSANRFAGSASWGAMVKLVPGWFAPRKLPFALGWLSSSYVFGGALAMAFAGLVASLTHDNWRLILGIPSVVLLTLLVLPLAVLPRNATRRDEEPSPDPQSLPTGIRSAEVPSPIKDIVRNRGFQVLMGLSFALTFIRETFNFWTVDYFRTSGGPEVSSSVAAMLSTPFDVCGTVGILLLGWGFGRIPPRRRPALLGSILGALGLLLFSLPFLARGGVFLASATIGLIGLLVYGPYSLLAGVLALEVQGRGSAATVAGFVDGFGYLAGVLSGVLFGRVLMIGGYSAGFGLMGCFALLGAALCVFLPKPSPNSEVGLR